jgi:hypothetical protein
MIVFGLVDDGVGIQLVEKEAVIGVTLAATGDGMRGCMAGRCFKG